MGMSMGEIATVCWQRSESEAEQDRAQAYWYVARHLEDRPGHPLVQLAADLEGWRDAHQQHAERARTQRSRFLALYEQQAAVYQEVLLWAKGEKRVEVKRENEEG
jgi:hypothetical protein